MPQRPAPRDLRASDTDRERVVAMLSDALADGRLTQDEHSERIRAALSAKTLGVLARLTADLTAHTITTPLKPGFDVADIGAGLVQAP